MSWKKRDEWKRPIYFLSLASAETSEEQRFSVVAVLLSSRVVGALEVPRVEFSLNSWAEALVNIVSRDSATILISFNSPWIRLYKSAGKNQISVWNQRQKIAFHTILKVNILSENSKCSVSQQTLNEKFFMKILKQREIWILLFLEKHVNLTERKRRKSQLQILIFFVKNS